MARAPMKLEGPSDGPSTGAALDAAGLSRITLLMYEALAGLALAGAVIPFSVANTGIRAGYTRPFWLCPAAFVVSLAALVAVRSPRLDAGRRLDVGLGWFVAMCAAVAWFAHSLPYGPDDVVRGPSAVALSVVVFAAVVPVPPRRLAVAVVLAALCDPLALLGTLAAGRPSPRPAMWLWLFLPTGAFAAVALVIARQIHVLRSALRAAEKLGSYRLLEKLGAGGMGEVWRAEHDTLARPAAIKLIRMDRLESDPARAELARKRFEREAQATAALRSPHTIEVYDFGTAEDGTFYYVMELLDGMDLAELVRRAGPLPPERVTHLLLQAARSLGEAHAQGMVHRDIKPANLYACRRADEVDVLKVLDFGLVKQTRSAPEPVTELTQADAVSGTPGYIAPEQALGQAVDGRADLYALGAVAFFLLTGRPVFEGVPLAVLIAHVNATPPATSSLVEIPAALDAIVARCLAKRPDDRFPDCEALADALRATGLAPRWTPERAAEWWAANDDGSLPPAEVESTLGSHTLAVDSTLQLPGDTRPE